MASLPTGTATFLFSDIEGSTQLLKQLGQRYKEVLADHKRLLQKAFEESSGLEIDTQGDAFFVVFNRAKDAVASALAAQRALAAHAWPDGLPYGVPTGMHTAEPSVTADGYVGLGVHRAARICSAGHGGQVLLSQSTQAVLADEVLSGIRLRDLGEHCSRISTGRSASSSWLSRICSKTFRLSARSKRSRHPSPVASGNWRPTLRLSRSASTFVWSSPMTR